jgi:hypothetical protein
MIDGELVWSRVLAYQGFAPITPGAAPVNPESKMVAPCRPILLIALRFLSSPNGGKWPSDAEAFGSGPDREEPRAAEEDEHS